MKAIEVLSAIALIFAPTDAQLYNASKRLREQEFGRSDQRQASPQQANRKLTRDGERIRTIVRDSAMPVRLESEELSMSLPAFQYITRPTELATSTSTTTAMTTTTTTTEDPCGSLSWNRKRCKKHPECTWNHLECVTTPGADSEEHISISEINSKSKKELMLRRTCKFLSGLMT